MLVRSERNCVGLECEWEQVRSKDGERKKTDIWIDRGGVDYSECIHVHLPAITAFSCVGPLTTLPPLPPQ